MNINIHNDIFTTNFTIHLEIQKKKKTVLNSTFIKINGTATKFKYLYFMDLNDQS